MGPLTKLRTPGRVAADKRLLELETRCWRERLSETVIESSRSAVYRTLKPSGFYRLTLTAFTICVCFRRSRNRSIGSAGGTISTACHPSLKAPFRPCISRTH